MKSKHHIRLQCQNHNFSYSSKRSFIPTRPPIRNYEKHVNKILIEYSDAEMQFDDKKYEVLSKESLVVSEGIYLTICSAPNHELPLESLDNRDIILSKVQFNKNNQSQEAIVFIPETQRDKFLKKFSEYRETISTDPKKNPKNKSLINSIEHIKLTNIEDFWTDSTHLFPQNRTSSMWWEIWVKKINDDPGQTTNAIEKFAKSINAELANKHLTFINSMVFLINTTISNLEKSLYLMSNLLELRFVPSTPTFLVNLNPIEQSDWVANLKLRTIVNTNPQTSICILDTGINYNHPLLEPFCSNDYSISYNPNWPKYDIRPKIYENFPYSPHGSMQAGIAGYGNLLQSIEQNNFIQIPHIVESARILPPYGYNKPELYGAITTESCYKIEIQNTFIKNRIFSLAVSANPNNNGSPSSWSAEIDRITFGEYSEFYKRLFVISTGNNIDLNSRIDLWEQAHLANIEDPAQSWNSITVGSMTNLTTITDPYYSDWTPWSEKGDISPSARTSVNWDWKNQAPLKPDFVLEGGNRLKSQKNQSDITNHDDVSILTTSGDLHLPFESHLDSSAASALASHYAALVADKYPEYWPETIRALLIHSCQYTPQMLNNYKSLINRDNLPKKNALDTLLRTVGYGVPDINKALNSTENHTHLVIQNDLKPFKCSSGSNIKHNEWHLIELPWPIDELRKIASHNVSLKVTLSYFIEPNPQNRGYKSRFSYQSHGLRFKLINPSQELENFKASINKDDFYDEYQKYDSNSNNWFFGENLRTKGSIHSDTWNGLAADLMTMNTIAIYPVTGWWKSSKAKQRWKNKIRYSLIISIECEEHIDIYSAILSKIENLNTNLNQVSIATTSH